MEAIGKKGEGGFGQTGAVPEEKTIKARRGKTINRAGGLIDKDDRACRERTCAKEEGTMKGWEKKR